MQNIETFSFAQLTDVHLGPLPPFLPRHWNVKRILGFINFRRNRAAFNDPTLANLLIDDLKQRSLDHVTVTGDLTNLGMPREFVQSHDWLRRIGDSNGVTVIPGNHDVYTRLLSDPGIECWRPYMSPRDGVDKLADLSGSLTNGTMATGFPFVRTFGRFAMIALNSAVYMPPAVAAGRLGEAQIERFVQISNELHAGGFVRIVLIHHPPLPEHGTHRGLRDAAAFEAALLKAGAELLVHGHNHRDMISWRDTRTGPLPMIGAAAAGEGRYNIYELRRDHNGVCRIEVILRAPDDTGSVIIEVDRKVLDPAAGKRQRII